jgi:oligosaccharide repeat unit polymerase
MNYVVMLINFSIIIFSCIILYIHYKDTGRVDTFSGVIGSVALYYGIIPCLFLAFIYNKERRTGFGYIDKLLYVKLNDLFISSLLCLSGVIIYSIFYKLFKGTSCKRQVEVKDAKKAFKIYGIIFSLVGSLSLYMIVRQLGGFIGAYKYTEAIRAYGLTNIDGINSNLAFLRPVSGVILLPPFLFYLVYREGKTIINTMFFLLSFIFATYYLIFNSGKAVMIMFYAAFTITFMYNKKNKIPVKTLIILIIVVLISIPYLNVWFAQLSYGELDGGKYSNSFMSLVNGFLFPYSNITFSSQMNHMFGYSYFSDYFNWIFNIIPISILSKISIPKSIPAYTYVTQFYDIGSKLAGGSPIDMVTFGMRQFGFIGTILTFAILGLISAKVDKMMGKLDFNQFFLIIIRISTWFFLLIPYADLVSNIRNRIDVILLMIIMFSTTVKYRIRLRRY